MVRDAERRRAKYEAKVDADVLARQTSLLKPSMVKAQSQYFPRITTIEERVKSVVEAQGVTTLQVRDYLNFGREMYELASKFGKTTLQAEAQTRVDKWVSRGLTGSLLVKVAQLFGVTPTAIEEEVVSSRSTTHELYVADRYYSSLIGCWAVPLLTVASMSPTELYAVPFPIPRKMRFDKLSISVADLTVETNIRMGIYASDGKGYPKDLIVDAGEVYCDGSGGFDLDIDQTLTPQLAFLALQNETGYPDIYVTLYALPLMGGDDIQTMMCSLFVSHAYSPLPDPFPSPLGFSNQLWQVGMRLKELL